MTFVAKHFVKTDEGVFTPGECFDAEFDSETLKRLVEIGAVVVTGAAIAESAEKDAETGTETDMDEVREKDLEVLEAEDDAEEDEPEMCEVPEIDVMDGIGTADEKPKKRGRARK